MMAVPAAMPGVPSKRAYDTQEEFSTKQRRRYHHVHRTNVKQEIDHNSATAIQDDTAITYQLERAIQLVLSAVGFNRAEPLALESLRACAEAYMQHFLEKVRSSMITARRVQPISQDFLGALEHNRLTLDALLVHLDPPVPAVKSQLPIRAKEPNQETSIQDAQLINHLLSQTSLISEPHVPRTFPKLPSRHTFKSEPVYRSVVIDAKYVREQATEEGRLGEEALRRLMSKKASGDNTLLTGLRSGSQLSLRQKSRALWRETYEESLRKAQPDSMDVDKAAAEALSHLGPAVNADSIYWRTPIARKITENVSADG